METISTKNLDKYKPLIDSELWPLIESYADSRCTQALKSYNEKKKLKPGAIDSMKKEISSIITRYFEEVE